MLPLQFNKKDLTPFPDEAYKTVFNIANTVSIQDVARRH